MPHVFYEFLDDLLAIELEEPRYELIRADAAMDLNVVSVSTATTALQAYLRRAGRTSIHSKKATSMRTS